ncbi:MAG: AI-2E family transporter [Gammaproteobacteria bacterium]|nr:AI-2E family transporter [Gammaproteobacteria bacterium]
MAFSLDEFYRLNRRALIWIILAVLLWLLRDFVDLIFLTFMLAFIATPLFRLGQKWLRLPYRISLVVVYLVFLLILSAFIRYVTPTVIFEANQFLANLRESEQRIVQLESDLVDKYPSIDRAVRGYVRGFLDEGTLEIIRNQLLEERKRLEISDEDLADYFYGQPLNSETAASIDIYFAYEDRLLIESFLAQKASVFREHVPRLTNALYQALATVLLALLFSFLILVDIVRLSRLMESLRDSRLRDFYSETAEPVARFGYMVGRGIQAQAMIALVNTFLTICGLFILSIPAMAVLSVIVFVCSFIPVLGVLISTVPILLVALNSGGLQLGVAVLVLIIVIHAIEAYLLNPLIYGRHFRLNPVIVLTILLVGYHLFGIWGLLLGVPVAQYFIHHVFGVPVFREARIESAN